MLTTSAILHVGNGARRCLGRHAVAAPRDRRLWIDDAVDARRIGGPQDRSEVVRILDAVEHDDERRGRCAAHESRRRCNLRASSTSATTP